MAVKSFFEMEFCLAMAKTSTSWLPELDRFAECNDESDAAVKTARTDIIAITTSSSTKENPLTPVDEGLRITTR